MGIESYSKSFQQLQDFNLSLKRSSWWADRFSTYNYNASVETPGKKLQYINDIFRRPVLSAAEPGDDGNITGWGNPLAGIGNVQGSGFSIFNGEVVQNIKTTPIADNQYVYSIVEDAGGYPVWGVPQTGAAFKAEHPNACYISDIEYYILPPGSPSGTPRQLNRGGYYCKIKQSNNYGVYSSNHQIYRTITGVNHVYVSADQGYGIFSIYWQGGAYMIRNNGFIAGLISNNGNLAGNDARTDYCNAIVFDPQDIIKSANKIGEPFVINNATAAINTPIDQLPDYVAPGVPENQTGGGDGDGDNNNDEIDDPEEPELTPVSTGVGLWAFDASECDLIAKFLWAPKSFLGGIAGTDADVTRAWVNAFYLPFDIVSHDSAHIERDALVYAGSYNSQLHANKIISGYSTSFDFGNIDINEYYGSFLDYPPYTSAYIYLPYIGYKSINVSDIMGKTVNVCYKIDLSCGTCTAIISAYIDGQKTPFAMFTGQIGVSIQVSGLNTSAALTASVQAAFQTAAIVGAAIPGASAGMSALGAAANRKTNPISATAAGIGKGAIIGNLGIEGAQAAVSGLAPHKPDAVSIGTAGGQSWLTCPQGCYIYIQRPRTATPKNFADLNGWATRYTGNVSEFTGFLSCSQVENTIAATDTEIAAINSALQNGIYI